MGGFAGQKVVHPLARRARPSLDRIKFAAKIKMVPLPVGAWLDLPIRCAQVFCRTTVSLMDFHDAHEDESLWLQVSDFLRHKPRS